MGKCRPLPCTCPFLQEASSWLKTFTSSHPDEPSTLRLKCPKPKRPKSHPRPRQPRRKSLPLTALPHDLGAPGGLAAPPRACFCRRSCPGAACPALCGPGWMGSCWKLQAEQYVEREVSNCVYNAADVSIASHRSSVRTLLYGGRSLGGAVCVHKGCRLRGLPGRHPPSHHRVLESHSLKNFLSH